MQYSPTLNLIYLPHLDYNLQRHGPYSAIRPSSVVPIGSGQKMDNPQSAIENPSPHVGGCELNPAIIPDLRAIDAVVGDLIKFFRERAVQVVLLSEYGITNVSEPIHLNRLFRERDGSWIATRDELGLELFDPGASDVFAVSDHQIAHVYLKNPSLEPEVRELLEQKAGATVLGPKEKVEMGIDHARAGDLVAIAPPHAWFTYYYWDHDANAPDFARTVDIHRKPGYDPVELF